MSLRSALYFIILLLPQDVLTGLASLRKLHLLLDVKLWAQGRSFQVSLHLRTTPPPPWVRISARSLSTGRSKGRQIAL